MTYGNTYDLYSLANLQGANNVVRSDSPLPFGEFTVVDPPNQTSCRILSDGRTLQPFEASTPNCTIQFDQQSNETYAPASVVITFIVVNKAPTTTTLASSAPSGTNPVYGETFTLTTTVSPANFSDFAATEAITLLDNGSPVASSTLTLQSQPPGVFAYTINPNPNAPSFVPAGTHPYTATYAGDHNYVASNTATALSQVIDPASTTTALGSSAPTSVYGQPVTFTATVTVVAPGRGIPPGKVTFTDGTTTLGAVALNAGVATLTLNSLAVGTHTINASYSDDSDSNYKASSNSLSQVVTAAPTTTTSHEQRQSVDLQSVGHVHCDRQGVAAVRGNGSRSARRHRHDQGWRYFARNELGHVRQQRRHVSSHVHRPDCHACREQFAQHHGRLRQWR